MQYVDNKFIKSVVILVNSLSTFSTYVSLNITIMKNLIILAVGLLITVTVMAQETDKEAQDTTTIKGPWSYKGMTSLNFSQVSLTNWAQGGKSSYAINGLAALNFNYTEGSNSWANSLDIGYGIQKIGEESPMKTDDHLELVSKYGRQTSKNWLLTGMLNFKTQFTEGFQQTETGKVIISDILSPGYFLLSVGMEYKKDDSFFALLSPATGKITVVANDSLSNVGSFGVEPGKKMRSEFGGLVKIGANIDLMENVNLSTTLDLFSNYFENPQNIDISWKALINMKINEYLSANISTHLIYDDDIDWVDQEGTSQGPKVQFKEMVGIGFSYKF